MGEEDGGRGKGGIKAEFEKRIKNIKIFKLLFVKSKLNQKSHYLIFFSYVVVKDLNIFFVNSNSKKTEILIAFKLV